MFVLPHRRHRHELRAFWTALHLVAAVMAGLALVAGLPQVLGLALFGVGVGTLVVGLLRPMLLWVPYRAFNVVARGYCRVLRALACWMCYYLVLPVLGRDTENLRLKKTATASLWEEVWYPPVTDSGGGWNALRAEWRSLDRRGYGVLVPLLWIVAVTKVEDEANSLPEGIYTIY